MSSHDQGKADGGGRGPPPVKLAATKKPSVEEIMNKLVEFQHQNPDIEVTPEGFAVALRKVAERMQAAEMMKDMTGASVDTTLPQLPHDNIKNTETNTESSTGHGSATQETSAEIYKSAVHDSSATLPTTTQETGQAGQDTQQVSQSSQTISIKDKDGQELGFWMKTNDVNRIVRTPNGSSFMLSIKGSSAPPTVNLAEPAGLTHPASSEPSAASASNPEHPSLPVLSKEDNTGHYSSPTSTPTVVVTPAADPTPATAPAPAVASTSSLAPAPVVNNIQGFSAASGATGTRKAAPPALNLAAPSRRVLKPVPTHYISMPAQSCKMMPPEAMDQLEKAFNWGKSQSEKVVLLRSPIKMMMPDNKEEDEEDTSGPTPIVGDYHVKPIPGASRKATELSTNSNFTLETPLTARFAKEQVDFEKEEKTKNEGSSSVFQPDLKALFGASASKMKEIETSSKTQEEEKAGPKGKGKGKEVGYKDKGKEKDVDTKGKGKEVDSKTEENEASSKYKGKKAHPTHRRTGKGIPRFHRLHLALETGHSRVSTRFDMIEALCKQSETLIAVCKDLPPDDVLTLYSVHRTFHSALNNMLRSSTRIWTQYNCPEAAMVYNWHSVEYRHLTIPDPHGRPLESPLTPLGFHPYRKPNKTEYKPEAASSEDTSTRKGKEKTKSDAQNDDEQVHIGIRRVPTLKWYAMCYKRQEAVEDILAHLARRGHRTPPGTLISVLKLWKLMATSSNAWRRIVIQNAARSNENINCQCYILEAKRAMDKGRPVLPLKTLKMMARIGVSDLPEAVMGFTDMDLLRIQCFFLKLDLRFNDPIYGPEDTDLSDLMLSQRSLFPLRQLLFGERYHTIDQMTALKMRYDLGYSWMIFTPASPDVLLRQNWGAMGVPYAEWGKGIREHWGELSGGPVNISPTEPVARPVYVRPNAPPVGFVYIPANRNFMIHVTQLVAEESCRRGLQLKKHLLPLMLWGSFDWKTGRNLCPTKDEIYMHDAEHKTRHIDTSEEFTRIEILKNRWYSLTRSEREEVLQAQMERDDELRKWDNNHMWDPLKKDEEDDHLVQLSYAITQPITGLTGSPERPDVPERRDTFDGIDIEPLSNVTDDSVHNSRSITAQLLELERKFNAGELWNEDWDVESALGDDGDDEYNGGGGGCCGSRKTNDDKYSTWVPTDAKDSVQLPQSFAQTLTRYEQTLRGAALSSQSPEEGGPSLTTLSPPNHPVYLPHLPDEPSPSPPGRLPGDPAVNDAYLQQVLEDLEEQLSDDGGAPEIGQEDDWRHWDWRSADADMWEFLRIEDPGPTAPRPGIAVPPAPNPPPVGTDTNVESFEHTTLEEVIQDAWAALQEAEEDSLEAGYRYIPADFRPAIRPRAQT